MNFSYDIYITTYKRCELLELNLPHWLKHIGDEYDVTIAYDDIENKALYEESVSGNDRLKLLPPINGKRGGARGNWEKCIIKSMDKENPPDFAIVFQDDCYPTEKAWMDDIDAFFTVSKLKHPFIQFVPTPIHTGHYYQTPLSICDQKGVFVRNEEQYENYIVQDVTIDSFVFSCIKLSILDDEDHITDPDFQLYANWHSELQMKLRYRGKIPWRSTHLKNLEYTILAMDFKKDTVVKLEELGGGMLLKEKVKFINRNKTWEIDPNWIKQRWDK